MILLDVQNRSYKKIMKLFIDDANVEKIKEIYAYYPVDGVTTNPSILAKTGRNPMDVLTEIRSVIQEDTLFVQAVAQDAEGMVEDAEKIVKAFSKIKSVAEYFGISQ